jgi:hypothetical protein
MTVNPWYRIITIEGATQKPNGGANGALPCSPYITQETKMKFALIATAAVATAAFVTPALAQAVIEDPGYCAQFYPNANCQNLGPGNPYTDGGYYRDNDWRSSSANMQHHLRHHMRRQHRH